MDGTTLAEMLATLRRWRGFDAATCLAAKAVLLNDYMRAGGLSGIVIGVSGGIDSAVALGIAAHAAKAAKVATTSTEQSPIKCITAALLPYFIDGGTTNQELATSRGRLVCEHYKDACEVAQVDLSGAHRELKRTADSAMSMSGDDWAAGQLVSYQRAPALFYLTSLLTQRGTPALVLGTTNRDEGGYIGYFGKAADAMVDLQIIADLHKSEVYSLARLLEIPREIIDAPPSGDIWDGRDDEQLIGASYDHIELYGLWLSLKDARLKAELLRNLSKDARAEFDAVAARLDTLNSQNKHKYASGAVAVHLDVYERAIPGGWRQELYPSQLAALAARPASNFVNPIILDEKFYESLEKNRDYSRGSALEKSCTVIDLADSSKQADGTKPADSSKPADGSILPSGSAYLAHSLLNGDECAALLAALPEDRWQPVGRDGMLKNFDPSKDSIGSYRATLYSERLAAILEARLRLASADRKSPDLYKLPNVRITDESTPTDCQDGPVWRFCGVSPVMRFIKYLTGGLLIPHYDAPYDYYPGKRTLMSVVVYLACGKTGATRFIKDTTAPADRRGRAGGYDDWQRTARPDEILCRVEPRGRGDALIMDHRMLHDSEELDSATPKIIMRTDLIWECCGLASELQPGKSRPLGLPEQPGTSTGEHS